MGSQKKMAKSSESYITSSSEWAGLGSDRKRTEQLFGKQYRMKIVGNNSNDIKRKFKLISPLISVSHIFYVKIQKEFVNFYYLIKEKVQSAIKGNGLREVSEMMSNQSTPPHRIEKNNRPLLLPHCLPAHRKGSSGE